MQVSEWLNYFRVSLESSLIDFYVFESIITYFGAHYKLITETHLITDHDTGIIGQQEAAMYEAERGFWIRKEAFMNVSSNSGLSKSLSLACHLWDFCQVYRPSCTIINSTFFFS